VKGITTGAGKISYGKRRFGLGLIRKKLGVTHDTTIGRNMLVINLEKLLELLFALLRPCTPSPG